MRLFSKNKSKLRREKDLEENLKRLKGRLHYT